VVIAACVPAKAAPKKKTYRFEAYDVPSEESCNSPRRQGGAASASDSIRKSKELRAAGGRNRQCDSQMLTFEVASRHLDRLAESTMPPLLVWQA